MRQDFRKSSGRFPEIDHTVELYTEEEIIETTAEHPFLTDNSWKDAADLQTGDKIRSRNEEDIEIKDVKFSYKPRKVYNFEVSAYLLCGGVGMARA